MGGGGLCMHSSACVRVRVRECVRACACTCVCACVCARVTAWHGDSIRSAPGVSAGRRIAVIHREKGGDWGEEGQWEREGGRAGALDNS